MINTISNISKYFLFIYLFFSLQPLKFRLKNFFIVYSFSVYFLPFNGTPPSLLYSNPLVPILNSPIFTNPVIFSQDVFYLNNIKYKYFLYLLYKKFFTSFSLVIFLHKFNFQTFYFYFLLFSIYTTQSSLIKFIRSSKPIFNYHLDVSRNFNFNQKFLLTSFLMDEVIPKKIKHFDLDRKQIYLKLLTKKIFKFYNRKLTLLKFKFKIYNTLGSRLAKRLKIIFNTFIKQYLHWKHLKDENLFYESLSKKPPKISSKDSYIFKSITLNINKAILKKISSYFNVSFNQNLFFISIKNYFLILLRFTSFSFIENFRLFFHSFIIDFIKIKHKLLSSKLSQKNNDKPYLWILHFKLKPTKTFYFTLTNSMGEVKFHFSNNFLFNNVKKAKYKIEISKSLKKMLLRFLRKNNIFFIDRFYTSIVTRKFVVPLFKFLKRNSIRIKNILFYRKISHSNHLKVKLRKARRI